MKELKTCVKCTRDAHFKTIESSAHSKFTFGGSSLS